jgi:hypothetical protein
MPRANGEFGFREYGNNGGAMHTGSISCILRGSVLQALTSEALYQSLELV